MTAKNQLTKGRAIASFRESRWSQSEQDAEDHQPERAVLFHVIVAQESERRANDSLRELVRLTQTAGGRPVAQLRQKKREPDAAYFAGAGKVDEIRALCDRERADLVIFDNALTAAQLRNLEERLELRVIDRTELILQIFAQRARTKEAQLQVELAQLRNLMPRLREVGHSLSRTGAGIGTRGPGETRLEADRRRARARVKFLTSQLAAISRHRNLERQRRRALPLVSLVGYTNTGKSTLLNALTGAGVYVDDKLFATLDPTIRQVHLPDQKKILLTDTVGFIRNLPHRLVAAFSATLEEIRHADLLLHLVDITDSFGRDHIRLVEQTLDELGADRVPRLVIFNKVDKVEKTRLLQIKKDYPEALLISAQTGAGLAGLLDAVSEFFERDRQSYTIGLPPEDGENLAWLHAHGDVVDAKYEEDETFLTVRMSEPDVRRFGKRCDRRLVPLDS